MANKKLQSNQNKKNSDGPTISSNGAIASAATTVQNAVNSTNSPINTNGTNNASSSLSAAASSTTNPGSATASQPNNQPHQQPHQRLSSSSSQSNNAANSRQQQQLPIKKAQHNDVDKASNAGSQASQNSFRGGGGAKDHRARDKEKEKNYRTGGGHNQQNQQRKKDKNRDHSSQSHRSGGYSNFGGGHHHNQSSQNQNYSGQQPQVKAIGFPSIVQSHPTSATASASQSAPNVIASVPAMPTIPPVVHHTKTVQTDPIVELKKEPKLKRMKPKNVIIAAEDEKMFKKTDPKLADTVMAFKEHDDWSKVELMCELLSFLSPVDLRLVGNCIEGSVRCYTNQMRPVEKISNCADPTASLPSYVCTSSSPPALPTAINQVPIEQQRTLIFKTFKNTGSQQTQHGLSIPQKASSPTEFSAIHTSSNPSSSSCSSSPKDSGIDKQDGAPTTPTMMSEIGESTENKPLSCQTVIGSLIPPQQDLPSPNNNRIQQAPPASANQMEEPSVMEPPVPQEPERFLESVRDLTSYVYILISVCASTNRKSAAKIADYVSTVLLNEKPQILSKIPSLLDRIDVLQAIGKIVAAIIHHPAMSVDIKIKYVDLRDGIRAEIEHCFRQYYASLRETERKKCLASLENGVGKNEEEPEESDKESEDGHYEKRDASIERTGGRHRDYGQFFITRFIGCETENSNTFGLEIHWSDGDRTFTQRTRDQLKTFQLRLLDGFGLQKCEKFNQPGMSSSISSFDEERKKLSASTSTMEIPFLAVDDRIVPRMPQDASPAQIVQYINELSDLPARIMLSAVICEEFNGTRSRTEDEFRESSDGLIFSRWKNPRTKSPTRFYQKNSTGDIQPLPLPINLQPFLYSGVPAGQVQTIYPSCSNCGGQHLFKDCDKMTLLDKKVEHKLRLDPESSQLTTSSSSGGGGGSHQNVYSSTPSSSAVPLHPIAYLDGTVLMNPNHHGNPHFAFHQNQQHQLQMMSGPAPYRPSGHFEGPTMMMYGMAPQQIVNNTNIGVNNGGNGANSGNPGNF